MRINETYEHESILPGQGEEGRKPNSSCNKVISQSVDVSAPVVLTPTASIDNVTVSCHGAPCVKCTTDPCGTSATITITQQVCVTVPVRYGVSMSSGDPSISCAEGGCSSAPCGCKG